MSFYVNVYKMRRGVNVNALTYDNAYDQTMTHIVNEKTGQYDAGDKYQAWVCGWDMYDLSNELIDLTFRKLQGETNEYADDVFWLIDRKGLKKFLDKRKYFYKEMKKIDRQARKYDEDVAEEFVSKAIEKLFKETEFSCWADDYSATKIFYFLCGIKSLLRKFPFDRVFLVSRG